jgi:hypothetical protein
MLHCCIGSGGVCFGSEGAFICAGGALCGVRALVWWFALFAEHGFVSDVSSCCPCLVRDLSFSSDLVLCLSLAFDRLLSFLFSRFFSFPFLVGYKILCVVNALIKGEIEDHVWFED